MRSFVVLLALVATLLGTGHCEVPQTCSSPPFLTPTFVSAVAQADTFGRCVVSKCAPEVSSCSLDPKCANAADCRSIP